MRKIAIIGHFGGEKKFSDGQTVKTKELYNYILKTTGEITTFDTYQITKNMFKIIMKINKILKINDKVILIVSSRGYKILLPVIVILNFFYRKEIYDFVIGGNRHNHLKNKPLLKFLTRQVKVIYLETHSLVENYRKINITNTSYLPNFKNLKITDSKQEIEFLSPPFKICTFSRISKEKGIEEIIEAVKIVNKKNGNIIYELDIFGKPDDSYKERFTDISSRFPSYICYKGLVDYNKSTEVLNKYFFLVFPTYHKGEGFPGTIIDAFASGLPVIATDWNCNAEIVEDGITGKIIPVKDMEILTETLHYYANNPNEILEMRKNCLLEAEKYLPETALKSFIEVLNN